MADLAVVVPSRGRPEAARALASHFVNTCVGDTVLTFAVNADDPTRDDYAALAGETRATVCFVNASTMVEALNKTAVVLARDSFAVGFMGDDHLPRTLGWDGAYVLALKAMKTGIVYGNDLLQGRCLPTQAAMTSDIVHALGFMAPPVLRHMYVDNFWLDLGRETGRLSYLPDVVVEHLHPIAGKATWDDGYKRVNDQAVYDADAAAYAAYQRGQFPADVAKVKAL